MKSVIYILSSLFISTSALGAQTHNVEVTNKGFEPNRIEVQAGEKVTLNITRKAEDTCATKITLPSEKIEKELPLNKMVSIEFTPGKKSEIKFGCAMNHMFSGVIVVN